MSEHLKKSEAELNELLAEYWRLRRETGKSICVVVLAAVQAGTIHRCIYGDAGNEAEYAGYIRVMTHLFSHVPYQCNLSLPPFVPAFHHLASPKCQSSTVSPTLTGSTYPVVAAIQMTMFLFLLKMGRSAQCLIQGDPLSALQVQ